jgi:hypothetical protein
VFVISEIYDYLSKGKNIADYFNGASINRLDDISFKMFGLTNTPLYASYQNNLDYLMLRSYGYIKLNSDFFLNKVFLNKSKFDIVYDIISNPKESRCNLENWIHKMSLEQSAIDGYCMNKDKAEMYYGGMFKDMINGWISDFDNMNVDFYDATHPVYYLVQG